MIWFWIIAALVISYLPLINKKIELSNYMWLLIPIDAYGIRFADATIKPYMVFSVILPLIIYAKNKGTDFEFSATKGQLLGGAVSALILIQSICVGNNMTAIKSSVMLVLVYMCAQLYASCSNYRKIEQLSDIFVASCFGCGAVFLISYIFLICNIEIGGIVAHIRAEDGMYMLMSNMSNGTRIEAYRLRGFAYDPNTMFPQFTFCVAACISKLFKKFSLYHIITLGISMFCIILSSSRMGLICFIFTVVISTLVNIIKLESVKNKWLSIIAIISGGVVLLIASLSRFGQSFLSSLLSTYTNRSSLTDEYGRFSIWKECLEVYWNENPLLGIGLGKMDEYTLTQRMTHNTWLQYICECGIIAGSIAILYFLTVMIISWANTKKIFLKNTDNTFYLCLVVGFTSTFISLTSVDNITCSYLWFSAITILQVISWHNSQQKNVSQI